MPKKHISEANFEEGYVKAIEIGIVTLASILPPEQRALFVAKFKKNVEVFEEVTLALPQPEEWRDGLRAGADSVLLPLEKNLPPVSK